MFPGRLIKPPVILSGALAFACESECRVEGPLPWPPLIRCIDGPICCGRPRTQQV